MDTLTGRWYVMLEPLDGFGTLFHSDDLSRALQSLAILFQIIDNLLKNIVELVEKLFFDTLQHL